MLESQSRWIHRQQARSECFQPGNVPTSTRGRSQPQLATRAASVGREQGNPPAATHSKSHSLRIQALLNTRELISRWKTRESNARKSDRVSVGSTRAFPDLSKVTESWMFRRPPKYARRRQPRPKYYTLVDNSRSSPLVSSRKLSPAFLILSSQSSPGDESGRDQD